MTSFGRMMSAIKSYDINPDSKFLVYSEMDFRPRERTHSLFDGKPILNKRKTIEKKCGSVTFRTVGKSMSGN